MLEQREEDLRALERRADAPPEDGGGGGRFARLGGSRVGEPDLANDPIEPGDGVIEREQLRRLAPRATQRGHLQRPGGIAEEEARIEVVGIHRGERRTRHLGGLLGAEAQLGAESGRGARGERGRLFGRLQEVGVEQLHHRPARRQVRLLGERGPRLRQEMLFAAIRLGGIESFGWPIGIVEDVVRRRREQDQRAERRHGEQALARMA